MQVFKTRWFARFVKREEISDKSLWEAIERAERGLIDADLGGGLIKQRVARQGAGRSDGYRVIIACRVMHRAVFLLGFAKNEQENIEPNQLVAARKLAAKWLAADAEQLLRTPSRRTSYRRSTMTKKPNRVTEALLETAEGMHRVGLLNDEEYREITIRHLGEKPLPVSRPISAHEIRRIRQRARMSQAAFARHLNLTSGYISQLERGTKTPKGPALALLNVIRWKGFEAIL